jgi:hypothetical protein
MDTEIEIKYFLRRLKISILDNKVIIIRQNIFKYIEYEISLEDIIPNKIIKSELNRDYLFIALLAFICSFFLNVFGWDLGFAILTLVCILSLSIGLFTKRRTITINTHSNSPIVFIYKKSNEDKIREFADLLIKKSKDYIINKYSKVDKDLPKENQLANIEYLRNNDLINDSKFEELKNIILDKNQEKRTTGFV